jgi:hypothetical protein
VKLVCSARATVLPRTQSVVPTFANAVAANLSTRSTTTKSWRVTGLMYVLCLKDASIVMSVHTTSNSIASVV